MIIHNFIIENNGWEIELTREEREEILNNQSISQEEEEEEVEVSSVVENTSQAKNWRDSIANNMWTQYQQYKNSNRRTRERFDLFENLDD